MVAPTVCRAPGCRYTRCPPGRAPERCQLSKHGANTEETTVRVNLFEDQSEPWGFDGTHHHVLDEDLVVAILSGTASGVDDVDAALALLTLADGELRGYGTDGAVDLDDRAIALVIRALRAVGQRIGIPIELPFRDFAGFRSYWTRKGASGSGGWQARRDILDDLLGDAFRQVEDLAQRPDALAISEQSLDTLANPTAIREHLRRIRKAMNDDPAQVVGSAKELIESTAKVVLLERGLPVDDRADVPVLVREAQQSLGLHPSSATIGPDGTDAIKKVLGGVSAIAIGIAELRNRGYGTGHGPSGTRLGLSERHAHLAVNAATTWCQLMLDTLADPDAPWRERRRKHARFPALFLS